MTIIGRKMIGSILLGAVVISSMPVNAADSRELVDITAPYIDLSTLEIDKQTVDAEETVTLKVKASDDLSGISYASVYYYGSNDQGSIALEYDAESGYLEGTFPATSDRKMNGKSELEGISVGDNAGNSSTYYDGADGDLSAGDYMVTGGVDVDKEAPTIDFSTLKVDRSWATAGDSVKVSVKVTDESGVAEVGLEYKMPLHDKWKEVVLPYNGATRLYEGYIYIGNDSDYGDWQITYIYARDMEYNVGSYGNYESSEPVPEAESATFSVEGTNPDLTPPDINLNTLSVSEKTATTGDTIAISFDGQGTKEELQGCTAIISYHASANTNGEDVQLDYNPGTGKFEGAFTIGEYGNAYSGVWKIDDIQVSDGVNDVLIVNKEGYLTFKESDYIMEDLSSADITVYGTGFEADVIPPVIDTGSIRLEKEKVSDINNFVQKIYFECSDNGRMALSGNMVLESESGKRVELPVTVYSWFDENDKDRSEGRVYFPVTSETECGMWKISYVEIRDDEEYAEYYDSGNTAYYYNSESRYADQYAAQGYQAADMGMGNFLVYGSEKAMDESKKEVAFSDMVKAENGASVTVDMGSATVLPQQILARAYEKGLVLRCSSENETIWEIDSQNLNVSDIKDTDLTVMKKEKDTGTISADAITEIAGSRSAEQLNFTGGGTGFGAVISLAIDPSFDSQKCLAVSVTAGEEKSGELLGMSMICDEQMSLALSRVKDCALVYGMNGDTSADGRVNIVDLMQTLHHVSGRMAFGVVEQGFSDVNLNGRTDITDLMQMLHYTSGRNEIL